MERKEIEVILLGIVAILAIVGLVLMFNSKMAQTSEVTGQAFIEPQKACMNVEKCAWNTPRTAVSQYLDPQGNLHVTCSCPGAVPPLEDVVVSVRVA